MKLVHSPEEIAVLEKSAEVSEAGLQALMLTAHSSIETAVLAMKQGAYDYLTKPFRLQELEVHIKKAFEKVQLARREKQWVHQVRRETPRHRLVGSSPVIRVRVRSPTSTSSRLR